MVRRIIYLVVCFILLSSTAFSQSRGLGVGFMFGMPTGLAVKAWTTSTQAIQLGIGWRNSLTNTGTYITGEYLWHDMHFIKSRTLFPIFYGLGGVIGVNTPTRYGARGILGIAFIPRHSHIDIFLQVAPVVYFSPAEFDIDGGLGIRYFF
ncbi:MAG: hypothetical protein ACLP05_04610 [Candidatus Kryptoniota bacterium]